MGHASPPLVKVTVSLPQALVEYADARAEAVGTNRSRVIAEALADAQRRQQEELAREGYAFYNDESAEFAQISGKAVAEALDDAGSAW